MSALSQPQGSKEASKNSKWALVAPKTWVRAGGSGFQAGAREQAYSKTAYFIHTYTWYPVLGPDWQRQKNDTRALRLGNN